MISKDKTYRTRDGREVRIYATDAHPLEPVHGAFQDYSGAWNSTMWRHDGTNVYGKGETDLIEVKPRIKRTVWMNVYSNSYEAYHTKDFCDDIAFVGKSRLACVKVEIDCEEGEGL
jgi:hypothetical protein